LQDIADPDWILQADVIAALATLPALNLSFDALVKPVHLTRIAEIAKQLPDLRIIIDHGGKPDMPADSFPEWAQMMAWLSEFPNVWCKLSGLLNESGTPPSLAVCEPYITHILTCFQSRTLWGSDWPVLELAGNYAQWVTHCKAQIAHHRADPQQVFRNAALDAYALHPEA
jgi:L-fuconolactonase